MSAPYLSVVVPAYNEEARITRTLERLAEYYGEQDYAWDVTIVSDGSTDRTEELVQEFCRSHPQFQLRAYRPNRGKGHAVRLGMLEAPGELILFCDADLATPQEETEHLLPPIQQGADIAIGSRPLRESRLVKRQPLYREYLGRAANLLIQALGVKGIHDTQCGFKIYRRHAAQRVFSRCKLNGFSFDFESLMIAQDLGLKIVEVPIRWMHQEGSKVVLWRDIPKALFDLIKLRLMGRARRLEQSAR